MMKRFLTLFIIITVFLGKLSAQNDGSAIAKSTSNHFSEEYAAIKNGKFVTIRAPGGVEFRSFASGPEDSKTGILVIHDFFGITPATKEAVEQLGALGYRTIAVDLYKGRSATTN